MISRLRGEVLEVFGSSVVVDCGGVGYEVLVPEPVLVQMPEPGAAVDLFVRHVFREADQSLYGFLSSYQRKLFDLLLSVQGCGPKAGLALLALGEDSVVSAIAVQDFKVLTRASGVGPKLAERIILELKDKINELKLERKIGDAIGNRAVVRPATTPLVDALLALGYRRPEAEAAANEAEGMSEKLEDQLRLALRSLAK